METDRISKKTIRIGSRDSSLAVLQSEIAIRHIEEACPEGKTELITMKTTGDRILDRPLDSVGGKGLFVKELDQALRQGRCDLTVHSLKDMPMETPEDLPVLAYLEREDSRDVLVLARGLTELPGNPVIGTSSRRRVLQGQKLFPGAVFKGVRGNITTRLRKLDDGEYDALILAAAGLIRMGLTDRISRYFEPEEMIPAAGQGILAVQGRREPGWEFVSKIRSAEAEIMAEAEREFVRTLDGGCSSPTAAVSRLENGRLILTGLYYDEDRKISRTGKIEGSPEKAGEMGRSLALRLKKEAFCSQPGKVYLTGAGPGDQGLMTIRGKEVLEKADTVIYDALAGAALLSMARPDARFIDVGKRSGRHAKTQEEINQILIEEGKRGGTVVRLKGGDPFVFGRGGEEAEALSRAQIPFEVIPGVSSAFAVAAYAGIPVTQRGVSASVHVITGHRQDGSDSGEINYKALAKAGGTLCFLMGVSAAERICRGLMKAVMSPLTPAAFIQEGTLASQKTFFSQLDRIAEDGKKAGIKAPAVLVVGEVCRLEESCSWIQKRPLSGIRIVVTRPGERAGSLSAALRAEGAEVIELPSIKTVRTSRSSVHGPDLPDGYLERISSYSWLVFTSPTGVEYFFEEMKDRERDLRCLSGIRFAVIGKATGEELRKRGFFPDYMPERFYSSELGKELAKLVEKNEKILILRAREGSQDLTEALSSAGIDFDEFPLYDTVIPEPSAVSARVESMISEGSVNLVTFTSGSTVRGFLELTGSNDSKKDSFTAVCIGERTREAARKAGIRKIIMADEPSAESLVSCILKWAAAKS